MRPNKVLQDYILIYLRDQNSDKPIVWFIHFSLEQEVYVPEFGGGIILVNTPSFDDVTSL